MKLADYGHRLVKLDRGYHLYGDNSYLNSQPASWYSLVRALGVPKNQLGLVLYHGHKLFCFWYKNSGKKSLYVAPSEYAYHKHILNINNNTILFDVYKCARDNGVTNVDIVQR